MFVFELVQRSATLLNIYESQEIASSMSDLMRSMLLYNYGGAWMDSDVLLVQNLAPILEEDWAVLMYADFVNQAARLCKVETMMCCQNSSFITCWDIVLLVQGFLVMYLPT